MSTPPSQLAERVPLDVPAPAVARHPDTITTPRALRKWLDDLPVIDTGRLVEQLSRQLSHLVRDPRPAPRFNILLRNFHDIIASLQEQAIGIRKQSAETRTHAQISLLTSLPKLLQELANGHIRHVALTLEAQKTPPAEDVFVAVLLLRRVIHWELLEYRMFRPAVWRQITQLYNVATLYRLEGIRIETALRTPNDPANIHELFFSTLALLLADPFRLPNHCLRELEERLPPYAEKLELCQSRDTEQRVPMDLSGQVPPLHYARQPDPSLPAYYVSLERLFAGLQPGRLDQAGCDLDGWLQESLGALVNGDRRERRHPRRARNADYHCIMGLDRVHERLCALRPGHSREGQEGSASPPALYGIPCLQTDVSASGSGFLIPGNQRYPDPGDWALFELDNPTGGAGASGFVGQIKRCMRDEDDYLRIGVERLLGNVIPVAVGGPGTPALFNADPARKRYRLIAPHGCFRADREDTLHGNNKNYRVRHRRLLSREGGSEVIELALIG